MSDYPPPSPFSSLAIRREKVTNLFCYFSQTLDANPVQTRVNAQLDELLAVFVNSAFHAVTPVLVAPISLERVWRGRCDTEPHPLW